VLSRYLAVRLQDVLADGYQVTLSEDAERPRCVIRHPCGTIVDIKGSSVDDAVLRALSQLRRHLAEHSP